MLAVLGNLLGTATRRQPARGTIDGNQIFNGFVLGNVIGVLIGFALATLIMNTAGAIVAYFVYTPDPAHRGRHPRRPRSSSFEDIAPWIEFNTAQTPLFEGDYQPSGEEWAQIATSGFIWLVVPLVLGIWRLMRIEFK